MSRHENGSFREDWLFLSELKARLSADSYECRRTGEEFHSGRPKWGVTFYEGRGAERRLITTRLAMELTSKTTGKPYMVVRAVELPASLEGQGQAQPTPVGPEGRNSGAGVALALFVSE